MYRRETDVREELFALSDEKFRDFATSLIPNCDNLIGARIPIIRK